jgi:hypothetical protein
MSLTYNLTLPFKECKTKPYSLKACGSFSSPRACTIKTLWIRVMYGFRSKLVGLSKQAFL